MAKHFHPLTIRNIRKETPDCISVSFGIPDELATEFLFRAGQNITLRMQLGGEELRRSYSICSSPCEKELRVAIKKAPGGRFSTYALDSLRTAQVLEVLPPTGNFQVIPAQENKKHYVALAAGSGITPVISILKTVLEEEPLSRFSLIYGNRTLETVIFREELEHLKNIYPDRFQLIHVFSREKTDAPINEGRIDAEKCERIFKQIIPIHDGQEFLLCGPAAMIFGLRDWLLQRAVDPRRIHYELFSDPGEPGQTVLKVPVTTDDNLPENTGAAAGTKKNRMGEKENQNSLVRIRLDGLSRDFQLPFRGEAILDAAIRQGADLPYACRAGVCASCRAKLLEGKVTMDQNYALAEEELQDGFILTCQAHPASPLVVIDFDIR